MSQKKDESAKDFIERTRDNYKRTNGSFALDLPRTVIDPSKVTFVKDNHDRKPTVYEREEKHQQDRQMSYRERRKK
jgi:3',5'-cyclic AMP phosphodiesterase CpdA